MCYVYFAIPVLFWLILYAHFDVSLQYGLRAMVLRRRVKWQCSFWEKWNAIGQSVLFSQEFLQSYIGPERSFSGPHLPPLMLKIHVIERPLYLLRSFTLDSGTSAVMHITALWMRVIWIVILIFFVTVVHW